MAILSYADADVMEFGSGMVGIPETKDEKQVQDLPWVAQYLKCGSNSKDLCEDKM